MSLRERSPDDEAEGTAPYFLSAGGEMGRAMRIHDWSTTELGSPQHWPQSLRSVVGLILEARQPMFVAWGPRLVFLYNDDYSRLLGAKHPGAMGEPFETVWSDIWPQISPIVEQTLAGDASFFDDLLIPMERHGYPEDAWFSFSYTPIRDESGRIAGMFCAATETTGEVLSRREILAERERLAGLFEQAPSFMAVLNGPQHRFELVNPAYRKLTGHREVIGKPVAEALPEAVEQGYLDLLDQVYESGEAFVSTGAKYAVQSSIDGPIVQRYVDFVFQPIVDASKRVTGIFVEGSDVTERMRGEEHLHLMINELNHRVKNSLATVQAIAAQTFRNRTSFEEARADFTARILALAKAHDVLTDSSWVGASIPEIVRRTLEPHRERDRFRIDGPDVVMSSKGALALSMAVHELCTNAVKYGALSVAEGEVEIVWHVETRGDDRSLHLRWTESGGPPVVVPETKGFGSRLVEYALAAELDGSVRIFYDPGGVVCIVDAPLPPVEPGTQI